MFSTGVLEGTFQNSGALMFFLPTPTSILHSSPSFSSVLPLVSRDQGVCQRLALLLVITQRPTHRSSSSSSSSASPPFIYSPAVIQTPLHHDAGPSPVFHHPSASRLADTTAVCSAHPSALGGFFFMCFFFKSFFFYELFFLDCFSKLHSPMFWEKKSQFPSRLPKTWLSPNPSPIWRAKSERNPL